ncbi:MAG: hypothetical protein ACP5LN_06210 [Thermoproteota archaeon]
MSQENVFRKIYNEVVDIPVIDIHTHLNPLQLKSNNLSEIVLYHYIATELVTSGMPQEILNIKDPNERVKRSLPFLKNIKNTSTFWALKRILSNLFDFNEELNENSFNILQEKFQDFEKNFNGINFLKERVKVRKAFLTLQFTDVDITFDSSFFTGSLRIEKLSKDISLDDLRKLEEVSSLEIKSARDLREAINTIFEKFRKRLSSVAISLNPSELILDDYKESSIDEAINEIKAGKQIKPEEKVFLLSFVTNEFLKLMKDSKVTFQLMLSVERPVIGASPPDYAIVVNEPKQLLSLCPLFYKYKEVNFDVISASRMQTHELNVVAKNYPNVFVSGFWWYSYYPSIMNEKITERLQMLPMNKWCAFFSDAYVPEWCFGKSQLVKHQLSLTLSSLVEQNYFTEELAIEIARKLLYENAVNIYHLAL